MPSSPGLGPERRLRGRKALNGRAGWDVSHLSRQQWLVAQTGLKPSTLYRFRSLLRAQLLPRWGRRRLADVTHAEVAAWAAQLVGSGLAPATVAGIDDQTSAC